MGETQRENPQVECEMRDEIQERSVREHQGLRMGCKLGQPYLSRDWETATEQKEC